MSELRDPPRWLESGYLTEELSQELAAYGVQAPAAASRARMLEQLSAQLQLAPALPAAKSLALVKLKLLLGSVALLAGAVGLLQFGPSIPAAAPALEFHAPAQPSALRMAPLALAALAESIEPEQPAPVVEPLLPQRKRAERAVRVPSRSMREPARHGADGGLARPRSSLDVVQELSMLAHARRALLNEPERALALTAEHARSYLHGTFEEEREVIAIESLFKLARFREARARARAFEASFPRSAHNAHLAKLIAKPSE
jgi:hypothetical protein